MNLINSFTLAEIESREGRLLRASNSGIAVEDHSGNRLQTPEIVMVPIHLFGNTYTTPFLRHDTTEYPRSNGEKMLLGAPFIEGARLDMVWQGPHLAIRAQGVEGSAVTLVKEEARSKSISAVAKR